jgi:hypothetical protein
MRRHAAEVVLAFAGGALLGVIAAMYLMSGSGSTAAERPSPVTAAPAATATVVEQATPSAAKVGAPLDVVPQMSQVQPQQAADTSTRAAFQTALDAGVARAQHEGSAGGLAEAAIWVDGWPDALVSPAGDDRAMRLWSTAKPPTALALMKAAEAQHATLDKGIQTWMEAAFERSENCPEREMVIYLQHLTGTAQANAAAYAGAAARAFRDVLARAGAKAAFVPEWTASPDTNACESAPHLLGPLRYPLTDYALHLGTTTWTIRDAAAFAHALAIGRYGANGRRVLELMAKPKLRSREEKPADFTAPLEWGAGDVFSSWNPAYKAGWGGTLQSDFMVVQYVVLHVNGHDIGIAAAFHPNHQPHIDDPGEESAWLALEDMFRPIRTAITRVYAAR